MTGGPLEYIQGTQCIVRSLAAVGSRYPAVVVTDPENAARMQHEIFGLPNVSLAVWNHFPYAYKGTKWAQTQELDKLNVLAAPYPRIVWLDADILVRSNIDALCELPDEVLFAAARNVGFRSMTCYDPSGSKAGFRCRKCSVDGVHAPRCKEEFQGGVLVIKPFNTSTFYRNIVKPIQSGDLKSRDGSDQGVLNTLVYDKRAFGDQWMILPSRYNALARVRGLRPEQWRQWNAAVVHYSRETKPWDFGASGTGRLDTAAWADQAWVSSKSSGDGLASPRMDGYSHGLR
eukprot:CAMPEP_0119335786 /NCGR_PEP_ID=MMETSP1333-20130426/90391_1 /TAXON_ID=418940 /ORGANISM="Scyphosphaera apsteinii, Strain RCC1455" /LENGTH=287 /DNA_ID=CAMNT_0007346441 /DNA_START=81 /DNA_END=941 /DNA_ORIENTATION=+